MKTDLQSLVRDDHRRTVGISVNSPLAGQIFSGFLLSLTPSSSDNQIISEHFPVTPISFHFGKIFAILLKLNVELIPLDHVAIIKKIRKTIDNVTSHDFLIINHNCYLIWGLTLMIVNQP